MHLMNSHFLKDFIYLFLERGKEREKEIEKHRCNISWLPLARPQLGNLVRNPGVCPDWELNQ